MDEVTRERLVAKLALLSLTRNLPRENCEKCRGTGKITCVICGGTGYKECPRCTGDGRGWGGLGECPCQYSEHVQEELRCSCKGTGARQCACIRTMRIVWEDAEGSLVPKAKSRVIAEGDGAEQWEFHVQEPGEGMWLSLPNVARSVVESRLALELATLRRQELRDKLRNLVNSLPDASLQAAEDALEALQGRP